MPPSTVSRLLDAAPFRAHAQHLMAVSNLPLPVVAVAAGVPLRALSHLVHGRAGRLVTRIDADHAAALYSLTPSDLIRRCAETVSAAGTRTHLKRLRLGGWGDHELAACIGVTAEEVQALLRMRVRRCPGSVALRATALVVTWEAARARPEAAPTATAAGFAAGVRAA